VKKPIIVGYDPGTTAALAIVDTKGNVLFLKSKRGFKRSEILDTITKIGKPLLIAGDRNPLPKSVEKLASILGCKTYYPKKSLSLREKDELTKDLSRIIEDEHEKDALASALQAFKVHSKLFKRAEITLSSIGSEELYERVIESVMLGKSRNLSDAIGKFISRPKKEKEKKVVKKKPLQEEIEELRMKLKQLESDVRILKDYNESLKKRLIESRKRVEYYRKKLEERIDIDSLGILKKKMKQLKEKLEESKDIIRRLKSLREIELKGFIPLIELKRINMSILEFLDETIGLKKRVLFSGTMEDAQILNEFDIKALVVREIDENMLKRVNFPVISTKDISTEKMKNVLVVNEEDFNRALKEARKKGFLEWVREYRKRKF